MIKCINPKGYKLTTNKEYQILSETNNMYAIINDSGLAANYNKNLFEIVPETPSFTFNVTDNVISNNLDNYRVILDLEDTAISCGIIQIFNINNVFDYLTSLSYSAATNEQREKAFIDCFDSLITENRMYLMSTNITNNQETIDFIEKCLEQMILRQLINEYHIHDSHNSNSGNQIRLWVIKT